MFHDFLLLDSMGFHGEWGRPDEGQLIPKGCGWSRFLSQRTQAGVIKPLVEDEEYLAYLV